MSRTFAALAPAALLAAHLSAAPAVAPSSRPALAVHVVDYAAVSNNEVARSEQEAARIWNNIDVSLSWSIGGAGESKNGGGPRPRALDATVLLLNQDMAQRMINQEHRGPGVLARAVPEAMRVYVFYDRVRTESERYMDARGVILGRVVAHELAHLLLGHTHSQSGLFRAEPDLGSARETFGREDAAKIRAGLFGLLSDRN